MKLRKATVVWVPAKSQSAFEGGAPAESCYLALLRVGKLSLKQVQLGQSKLDCPLGTEGMWFFYSLQIQIKGLNILNINLQSAESEQLFTRNTWGYLKLKTFTFLSTKGSFNERQLYVSCDMWLPPGKVAICCLQMRCTSRKSTRGHLCRKLFFLFGRP